MQIKVWLSSFYSICLKCQGGVRGIENTAISVMAEKVGNSIKISVSDNGQGIVPEARDKIFILLLNQGKRFRHRIKPLQTDCLCGMEENISQF